MVVVEVEAHQREGDELLETRGFPRATARCRERGGKDVGCAEIVQALGAQSEKDGAAAHEAKGAVEVEVTGANAWGDHVTGTVTVTLPRGA